MTRQSTFKRKVRARMDEDRRELHGRAPAADRGRRDAGDRPDGGRAAGVRRGGAQRDRADVGRVVRAARRVAAPSSSDTRRDRAAGSPTTTGSPGWWAQSVTVAYEQARGMRAPGQKADGWEVTASKTVDVPVERLYEAFTDDAERERWLPGAEMRLRTATAPKSARYDWEDGSTRVVAGFETKGEGKSVVALAHQKLPDADTRRGDEGVLARAGAGAEGDRGGRRAMRESERQVERLVAGGYPALAGLAEAEFRERLEPLAELHAGRTRIAVVAVRASSTRRGAIGAVDAARQAGLTVDGGRATWRDLRPIDGVEVPAGFAYLVTGIDTGAETLNVTPEDALPAIQAAGRSPLTIEEGLAIVTQHPELLRERNCFSLLGSRCGDRRVTALWIKRGGRPRLGWCYAGAPHTWLGSASCAGRVGV